MGIDPTAIVDVDAFTASVPRPQVGSGILAEDVEAGLQAVANRTKNLSLHKVASVSGTASGLTLTGANAVSAGGTLDMLGTITIEAGGELHINAGSVVEENAASYQHGNMISLTDADHTLDLTTGGQRIVMRTAPAGNRILTLKQTTALNRPPDGYWFEITAFMGTSAFTIGIQREGAAGTYVAVLGDGVGTHPWSSTAQVASVRVKKEGGIWRLEFAGAGPCFFGGDA